MKLGINENTLKKVTLSSGNCKKELMELLGSDEVLVNDLLNIQGIDEKPGKMTEEMAQKEL